MMRRVGRDLFWAALVVVVFSICVGYFGAALAAFLWLVVAGVAWRGAR